MVKAKVFVSGFVQGVGFRQFVKRNSVKIGLKGFVRNLSDGRVEAILVGDKADVEKMILLCRKGPFLSEVKDINVFWEENEEKFETFEILP